MTAVALLALPGCTSPGAGHDDAGGGFLDEPDPVLRSVDQAMRLATGVAVGAPGRHAWVEPVPSGKLTLETAPHARQLVVELVGRADEGAVVLHAIPPQPMGEVAPVMDAYTLHAPQDGFGRARLVVDNPRPGQWAFDVHADGVVAGFAGHLYVTALAVPIEGFTLLPPP